jgi:aminoglycoside phosphotransferase family enzyme
MIVRKTIDLSALKKAGVILARFYNRVTPVRITAMAYRQRLSRTIRQNMRALAMTGYRLSIKRLHHIAEAQMEFLKRRAALFDERVRKGRIVEAHGDLRPDHVFLLKPNPVIIDCLEFNREFRLLDPVDELAYLALECERLGAPFIEDIIFAEYTRVTSDSPPATLIAFYKSYRACLRAKLALWHLKEPNAAGPAHWTALARAYLRLAERYALRLA